MYQRANLHTTNLRIDYVREEIRKSQEQLDKLKKALEKYGERRLGKSYDDAYSQWGGPDPRMSSGDRPNEKYYTSKGKYVDIDTLGERTSTKFEDKGSLSLHIKFYTERIESYKKTLEGLINDKNQHLESVHKTGFDLDGFDADGYDQAGFNLEGYNRAGYDKDGLDRYGYDMDGYNKDGLDYYGFDKDGIHFETKTRYGKNGLDREGFTEDGFTYYHGIQVDREGYGRDGFQVIDSENLGYNREGFNREGYNKDGVDREGRTKQEKVLESRKNARKLITPYYRAARLALVNWNGLTQEEARKTIVSSSFDEIESQVYAKQSMTYALEGLRSALAKRGYEMSDEDFEVCMQHTFEPTEPKFGEPLDAFGKMRETIAKSKDKSEIVVEALSAIHDGWVKDNGKKFMARDKKYQHMPLELIGLDEVKSDLLFLEPILLHGTVTEQGLSRAYYKKVDEFFTSRNIRSREDLQQAISQGSEFYPALEGQEDIIAALSDSQIVSSGIMQKLDSKVTKRIEKVAKRDGATITLDKIDRMTSGVRTPDFQKATTTIRENAQEQTKENDAISLDDE